MSSWNKPHKIDLWSSLYTQEEFAYRLAEAKEKGWKDIAEYLVENRRELIMGYEYAMHLRIERMYRKYAELNVIR